MSIWFRPIFLLFFGMVWGIELQVSVLLDAGIGSLRQALLDAQDGDRIVFDPGLLGTILLLSSLPSIDVDVEIEGPASENVTISGNSLFSVFDIGTNRIVTINNLQITNAATAASGSGLFLGNDSKAVLSNISFDNCSATGSQGGAVHVGSEGTLEMNDVTFSNNSSGGFGDDIYLEAESSLILTTTPPTNPVIEIFGTGNILKKGTGDVTLTVPSSTALTFVVEEGKVISTGIRTDPSIVFGTLEGSQTSKYVANHGIVKPSETIGTMATTGDYHQSQNATLEVAITPASNDLLAIGGNASLSGTLSILPEAGSYTINTQYTILTTGGVIVTRFDQIISSSMTFDVHYFSDRVDIEITSL